MDKADRINPGEAGQLSEVEHVLESSLKRS